MTDKEILEADRAIAGLMFTVFGMGLMTGLLIMVLIKDYLQ